MSTILRLFALSIFLTFILSSFGEKVDELKNTMEVMKNLPEAAQNLEEATNLADKKLQERKAKGDTLAMNFKDLMLYLPASLDGFKADEPEGSTTNSMGFSFSQVSRNFTKMVGDQEQSIRIELIDYNAGYSYLSGLAYWTNLNISTETTNGFERTVKTNIENVYAYEKFQKDSKNASIMYVLGYRFILNIEGNNVENFDLVKNVANKIDLKKLAAF